jgi:hypothetical protein
MADRLPANLLIVRTKQRSDYTSWSDAAFSTKNKFNLQIFGEGENQGDEEQAFL